MWQEEMTAELARSLWSYDPETGVMRWKVRNGSSGAGTYAGQKRKGKSTYYIKITYKGKDYFAHRLAWLIVYGVWPDDQIDHEDGDGLNNRLKNLRDATNTQNCQNKRLCKTNTSGICGVSWNKESGKWAARINVDRKNLYLGYFDNKEDAIAARKEAEVKYGYHQNHGKARSK